MARRFGWVIVAAAAVAMLVSSTPAERAAAVHEHTWEPWATHIVTADYNATITVTWTDNATGASFTRSCTLTKGYLDQSQICVSGPLPGSFTSIPDHTVTSHSIAWHDPRTFDLLVCTPTGEVIDTSGHQQPSGEPCASPPPTTTSTTSTSTTTTTTTTTTTLRVRSCEARIKETVESLGGLQVVVKRPGLTIMPIVSRWTPWVWVETVSNNQLKGTVKDLVPADCSLVGDEINYAWSSPDVGSGPWGTSPDLDSGAAKMRLITEGAGKIELKAAIEVNFGDGSTAALTVRPLTLTLQSPDPGSIE